MREYIPPINTSADVALGGIQAHPYYSVFDIL